MQRIHNFCFVRTPLGLFYVFSLFASPGYAESTTIASRTADIDAQRWSGS